MKIRRDFVTNSSSSSYLVIYEISDPEKAKQLLHENWGKKGLEWAKRLLTQGKDLVENEDMSNKLEDLAYDDDNEELSDEEIISSMVTDFSPEKWYWLVWRIAYTNEGSTEGAAGFLLDQLPNNMVSVAYQEDPE